MKASRQQLLDIYTALDPQARATLCAFAEFLAARGGQGLPAAAQPPVVEIPAPENIERPAGESIVAALKRLARTYPMLDKSEMLSATSDMVANHVMQGSDPVQVIDQLEAIFADHYQQLTARSGSTT